MTAFQQAQVISPYSIPGLLNKTVLPTGNDNRAKALVKVICDYFNLSEHLIKKRTRNNKIVMARHFFFYFCRKETTLHLKQIAEYVSPDNLRMDHTTVIHGVNRIIEENMSKFDNDVKKHFEALTKLIN